MCSRSKPPHVGEVQILSNQEPLGVLRCMPDFRIGLSAERLLRNRIDIVSQL